MKYTYILEKPQFVIENISFENVARSQNYKYHNKCRAKHAFIYTVSGTMQYTFLKESNRQVTVGSGELIFVPKNCDYSGIYLGEHTETKIIHFDTMGDSLPPYLSAPHKIDFPKAAEHMETFFTPLMTNDMSHPFYYLSRIYELLWLIDVNYSGLPAKYKRLQLALSEMTEHYNQNEKTAYYASLCGMGEVQFRRLFHEYTGKSPIEYRNEIRLINAQMKLQSGMYNVSEVAEAVGFSNLSFFTRLYKEKFGHTPKKE